MLSFVRDFFVPARARPYLTGPTRTHKSASTNRGFQNPHTGVVVNNTRHISSEQCQEQLQAPKVISPHFSNVSAPVKTTNTTILESSAKDFDSSSNLSESQKQSQVEDTDIIGHVESAHDNPILPQNLAGADIPNKLKRAQISPADLGYTPGSDNTDAEISSGSNVNKIRRLRKRISEKCKKVWRKGSDAIHEIRHENNADRKEPDFEFLNNASNEHTDNNEEDEEDEEDGSHPRCDFKTIEAISDERLETLVRHYCNDSHDSTEVRVVRRTKGAYNFAAIVSLSCPHAVQHLVVRVPGHATLAHWKSEDRYMMDCEVQVLQHIGKNTKAPVPEIINHSTEHTNLLGFPYILMTELPGKPASSIWYDSDYDNDDFDLLFQHADIPSTAIEKKRITFLRSLPRIMTDIQFLSFNMGGMITFSDASDMTIGPMYAWGNTGSDAARTYQPFRSTQEYAYLAMVRQLATNSTSPSQAKAGALKFFNLIFSQTVFKAIQPETFTIHHTDLDLQNILVDDEGNVTGIIDWDKAFAAPRCMGAAAAPLFLQKDWLPDHLNNLSTGPHMCWKTHRYREIYAAALAEAGNSDAIFTTKSALYRASLTAIHDTEGGSMHDLLDKVLRETPHCRIKTHDFKRALGVGWQDAEDMLKIELAKIFEPELPSPDFLEKLDAEMDFREWLLAFNVQISDDDEDNEEDEDVDSRSGSEEESDVQA